MANKKRKTYGIPYQGSKNRIAEWVVDKLPPSDVLADVFAGGCAITHCAALSGKYGRIICNDIGGGPELFRRSMSGEFSADKMEWVSREDFFARKETDPYVKFVWSFGNNGTTYLYSREIEPYKKAVFEMLTAPTLNERRIKFHEVIRQLDRYLRETGKAMPTAGPNSLKESESGHQLNSVMQSQEIAQHERISCLDSVMQSEHLTQCRRIEMAGKSVPDCPIMYSRNDYRSLDIPDGAVIYCDPPYYGTGGYGMDFDHTAFWEWCRQMSNKGHDVYVSEYSAPDDFECVASKNLRTFMSSGPAPMRTEKIFRMKKQ